MPHPASSRERRTTTNAGNHHTPWIREHRRAIVATLVLLLTVHVVGGVIAAAPPLTPGETTITSGGLSTDELTAPTITATGHLTSPFSTLNTTWAPTLTVNTSLTATLNSSTYANLPTAGTAGRVHRVTDTTRGLWMDTGTQWAQVGGRVADAALFGAACNGSANDTTPIQNAINAVKALGGGLVQLPRGTCNTYTLTIDSSGVHMRGYGPTATRLSSLGAADDVIWINGGAGEISDISVSDLGFATAVTKTAGAAVHVTNGARIHLHDLQVMAHHKGIVIDGANTYSVFVDQVDLRNIVATSGIGIWIRGGNDHYLSRIIMDNSPASQPLAGIRISQSDATWIDNSDIIHGGYGLLIDPGAGEYVEWVFVTNSAFDNSLNNGVYIHASANGVTIKGVHLTASWTSSNDGNGVAVEQTGTGAVDGVRITAHRSFLNDGHGIAILGGSNVHVSNSDIAGNSAASSGTNDGITVAAGVSYFSLIGNRIGASVGFANTQAYGIDVVSGASDQYMIADNNLIGNVNGGLSDNANAANRQVYANLPLNENQEQLNLGGRLELGKGIRFQDEPPGTCTSTQRGDYQVAYGGGGAADGIYWCAKSAADTYSWVLVKGA